MKKQNLDRDWTLKVMNPLTLAMGESVAVDLPHDYSITQKMDEFTHATASNAFLPGGVIQYEKKFFAPAEWSGSKIMLEFEGVYMNSVIRLNANIVGRNPYGYTSFHCDLTPYIKINEENILTVHVNNSALANSRWYSGTGIYRHVWLLTGKEAYVKPWGIFVTTPAAKPDEAVFEIKTQVSSDDLPNGGGQNLTIRQTLRDASGAEAGADELGFLLNGEFEATQQIRVSHPTLWSVDNPYLYTLVTQVIKDGEVIDSVETKTGAREISFSVEDGFRLNGKSMKLKGGCVHHDCGLLGSAAYDRAEQRKVALLKESGYNAVRCAHNPPSPAFLDACDAMGMLVIDEAFDCWNEKKMENDYSVFFGDWWEKDLTSMVLRDRNHPSVIMWSIGNEIPERDGRSDGNKVASTLASFVKKLDNTRAITNALCGIHKKDDEWGELTEKFAEPLDVVGYNYMLDRYEKDGTLFPERIICGTETFPKDAFAYWEAVEKFPYVIGDFVWTGLDYLGEAGIGRVLADGETGFVGAFPWSHANCGDIDICGFKRPQSYYRDCVWGVSKKPYIAVQNPSRFGTEVKVTSWGFDDVYASWTWPGFEGKGVQITVYSTDDEVELFLNQQSLGRKPAGKDNQYTAKFESVYESGELVAVSYAGGKESGRTVLKTAGKAERLCLMPDREELCGFGDLCYVMVDVMDQNENPVHNADHSVYLTVSGAGSLLAVGSGNPKTDELYTGNVRKLHGGKGMAVVRSNGTDGEITITASAEGIKTAVITIKAKA